MFILSSLHLCAACRADSILLFKRNNSSVNENESLGNANCVKCVEDYESGMSCLLLKLTEFLWQIHLINNICYALVQSMASTNANYAQLPNIHIRLSESHWTRFVVFVT